MKAGGTISDILKAKGPLQILSIAPQQSVFDALELLARYDIGALMVISEGQLIGILSERDYARKCVLLGLASKDTLVSQIMTSPVVSITPRHTVDECMSLMTSKHFRHLPVVDNDTVVGLVSIGDLVKSIIGGHEKTIQELEGYIAGAWPA